MPQPADTNMTLSTLCCARLLPREAPPTDGGPAAASSGEAVCPLPRKRGIDHRATRDRALLPEP